MADTLRELIAQWRSGADGRFSSFPETVVALHACADELEAALTARVGEATPPEALHQFPCGHFGWRIRRGDGSLHPAPSADKCVPCRELEATRARLAAIQAILNGAHAGEAEAQAALASPGVPAWLTRWLNGEPVGCSTGIAGDEPTYGYDGPDTNGYFAVEVPPQFMARLVEHAKAYAERNGLRASPGVPADGELIATVIYNRDAARIEYVKPSPGVPAVQEHGPIGGCNCTKHVHCPRCSGVGTMPHGPGGAWTCLECGKDFLPAAPSAGPAPMTARDE